MLAVHHQRRVLFVEEETHDGAHSWQWDGLLFSAAHANDMVGDAPFGKKGGKLGVNVLSGYKRAVVDVLVKEEGVDQCWNREGATATGYDEEKTYMTLLRPSPSMNP